MRLPSKQQPCRARVSVGGHPDPSPKIPNPSRANGIHPAYGCNLSNCYAGCDANYYGNREAIQRCYRGCERSCG